MIMAAQRNETSSFTILLTHEEDLGLQNALKTICDHSSKRITKEIIWLSQNSSAEQNPTPYRIVGGRLERMSFEFLQEEMARSGRIERVDIFASCSFFLAPTQQDLLSLATSKLEARFNQLGEGQQVASKRIFFPQHGHMRPKGNFFPPLQTTNIIVTPEDREFPGTMAYPFDNLEDESRKEKFFCHIASELISLTGMWITMEDHLLTDLPASTGGSINAHICRSFVRSAVSTSKSADDLLILGQNLPKPEDHEITPNYRNTIRQVAEDAMPSAIFTTAEPQPANNQVKPRPWHVVKYYLKRVGVDLIQLPRVVKDGLHSQIEELIDTAAEGISGKYTWVKPFQGFSNENSPFEGEPMAVDDLIAELGEGRELNKVDFPAEAWIQLNEKVLGAIDGSSANLFTEDQTVVVHLPALVPSYDGPDLKLNLVSLGADPEELDFNPTSTLDEPTQTDEGSEVSMSSEAQLTEVPGTINEPSIEKSSETENLLSLLSEKMNAEFQRVHDRIEYFYNKIQGLQKPTSDERSIISRVIQTCFIASFVIALLSITTLQPDIRELIALDTPSGKWELGLLIPLIAALLIPTLLLHTPKDKSKSIYYITGVFSSVLALTVWRIWDTVNGDKKTDLTETIGKGFEQIFLIAVGLLIAYTLLKPLAEKARKSQEGGEEEEEEEEEEDSIVLFSKKFLKIFGPIVLIIVWVFNVARSPESFKFVGVSTSSQTVLLIISLVFAVTAFIVSAALNTKYQIEERNKYDKYVRDSYEFIGGVQDAVMHLELIKLIRIHWYGMALILKQLITHPFGYEGSSSSSSNLTDSELSSNVESSENTALKAKIVFLNLTETGRNAFKIRAADALATPGWLTTLHNELNAHFINDDEIQENVLPAICQFPVHDLKEAIDKKNITAQGTRWPFVHWAQTEKFNTYLRESANNKLAEARLNTFLEVAGSWESHDNKGRTSSSLEETFFEIAPSETPPRLAMGSFGDYAGRYTGSGIMNSIYVWPSEIVPRSSNSPEPLYETKPHNLENVLTFQAIRLDISDDPIDLDEIGPPNSPNEGAPPTLDETPETEEDGFSLFSDD